MRIRDWSSDVCSSDLRAVDLHRALVELAARFLVRACEPELAQRIDDADPFGGRDGLRQIAAYLSLFKGLGGGVGSGLCGLFAAAHRGRFVGEDLLRLVDLGPLARLQPRDLHRTRVGEKLPEIADVAVVAIA